MTKKAVDEPSVERRARALYETQDNRVVPAWDSLGAATKSVWHRYVETGSRFRVIVPAKTKQPTKGKKK